MFKPLCLAATLAAMLASASACATAGYQHLFIADPRGGAPLEVGVWYPASAPGRPQAIELNTQIVAQDAPVEGKRLHLIVLSHGHLGSFAGHYDTAVALAEAGFVVASVTHDSDSWRAASRPTHIEDRPRQLEALTNYMMQRWPAHERLDPTAIGAFGFSAGGLGVLVFAGGAPDLSRIGPHCRDYPDFADCRIIAQSKLDAAAPHAWVHDARVKAVVVASPALGFAFGKAGLADVTAPVQLWRGEDDPVLPNPYYAEAVREDLPRPPDMHVVPGMGHYEFLAPCSNKMAQRLPEICAHEPGFDPIKFHAKFNSEVVNFFKANLSNQKS